MRFLLLLLWDEIWGEIEIGIHVRSMCIISTPNLMGLYYVLYYYKFANQLIITTDSLELDCIIFPQKHTKFWLVFDCIKLIFQFKQCRFVALPCKSRK
jgi:hypothetical protein